jgi:hypothetical protein
VKRSTSLPAGKTQGKLFAVSPKTLPASRKIPPSQAVTMNSLTATAGKRVSLPDALAGNWQGTRELLFNLINILDA